MSITIFDIPIPVIVEDNKKGYALYVSDSGVFENDVWTIVHCEGGIVRHYNTSQIKVEFNSTFGIEKLK